jgi:hypothetical protein
MKTIGGYMKTAVSAIVPVLCILVFTELAGAEDEVRGRPIDVYISLFGSIASPLKTDVTEGGITAKDSKLDNSLPSVERLECG